MFTLEAMISKKQMLSWVRDVLCCGSRMGNTGRKPKVLEIPREQDLIDLNPIKYLKYHLHVTAHPWPMVLVDWLWR